ncbi:hypothetical protein D3C87_1321990 [compost metagenome]
MRWALTRNLVRDDLFNIDFQCPPDRNPRPGHTSQNGCLLRRAWRDVLNGPQTREYVLATLLQKDCWEVTISIAQRLCSRHRRLVTGLGCTLVASFGQRRPQEIVRSLVRISFSTSFSRISCPKGHPDDRITRIKNTDSCWYTPLVGVEAVSCRKMPLNIGQTDNLSHIPPVSHIVAPIVAHKGTKKQERKTTLCK